MKRSLAEKFDIKDLGKLHHFLRMKIVQNEATGKVWVGQQAYTENLLKKFGMEDAKQVATPVDTSMKLQKSFIHYRLDDGFLGVYRKSETLMACSASLSCIVGTVVLRAHAALGTLTFGPRVSDFPYTPRTHRLTYILQYTMATHQSGPFKSTAIVERPWHSRFSMPGAENKTRSCTHMSRSIETTLPNTARL